MEILYLGINLDVGQYLAIGFSSLYVTSQADNVKRLALSDEFSRSTSTTKSGSVIISGSLGGSSCARSGLPTYLRKFISMYTT